MLNRRSFLKTCSLLTVSSLAGKCKIAQDFDLQAEIDAAYAAGGGEIVLPSGVIDIYETIYPKTNVHLKSYGGTTLRAMTPDMRWVLVLGNGYNNMVVDGISIDCNAMAWYGVGVHVSENVLLRRAECYSAVYDGFTMFGIDYEWNKNTTLEYCYSHDNARAGYTVIAGEGLTLYRCRSKNQVTAHFDIEPNREDQSVKDVLVHGCDFSDETGHYADGFHAGFIVDGQGENVRVIDNVINAGAGFGRVSRCSGLQITDNIVSTNTPSDLTESLRISLCDGAQISGNHLTEKWNNPIYGFQIKDCDNVAVINNRLDMPESAPRGIFVKNGDSNRVVGNVAMMANENAQGIMCASGNVDVIGNHTNAGIQSTYPNANIMDNRCRKLTINNYDGVIERDNRTTI